MVSVDGPDTLAQPRSLSQRRAFLVFVLGTFPHGRLTQDWRSAGRPPSPSPLGCSDPYILFLPTPQIQGFGAKNYSFVENEPTQPMLMPRRGNSSLASGCLTHFPHTHMQCKFLHT